MLITLAVILCTGHMPGAKCETITPPIDQSEILSLPGCTLIGQQWASQEIMIRNRVGGPWVVGRIRCTIGTGKRDEKAT